MFDKNLKRIMREKDITVSQLSRKTGFSKSAISQYASGNLSPSPERVEILAKVLGCSVSELMTETSEPVTILPGKTTLTCKEAAALMHKHESYVRLGLQQGRSGFEFGTAVKTSGKWSYCIYAKKFTEVTGIPVNGI